MHITVGDVVDWGNLKNCVVADTCCSGYMGNDGKMHCVNHVHLKWFSGGGTWCPPEKAHEIKLSFDRRTSKEPRALKIKDKLTYYAPGEFFGRGCEIVSVDQNGWRARTYYKKVAYEHAVWDDVGNPDLYEHDDGSPIMRASYDRPTDRKLQRLAGAHVCLSCGNYSSAMTCASCNQADVQYVQDKLAAALQIPKQYLGYGNPMAVEEDYYLPARALTPCTKCGFEACACEALGYSDEPTVDCTLNHLAQAIFDSDPEVLAFVAHVGEEKHAKDPVAAKKRALDIAWERDEQGWATRARERAAAVKGAL